jgi:[acyl-carrier-protein] S-malonyltransferase
MNSYAVVCSGQGGLGFDVFSFSKQYASGMAALEVFSNQFDWNLLSVENGEIDLGLNTFSQPLTVAASIANWEVLKSYLPSPRLFAGYSAGEVSALGCAGALDLFQMAELSFMRCAAMEKSAPKESGMMAVKGLSKSNLMEALVGSKLHIAISNEDDHFIIAGANAELDYFENLLQKRGIWCKKLLVSLPSHTPILLDASIQFESDINQINWLDKHLPVPVIQGINGKLCNSSSLAIHSLKRAISEPINWQQCMNTILDEGVKVVLELGPGNTLAKMISSIHPAIAARSVVDFRTPEGIRVWLLRQLEL